MARRLAAIMYTDVVGFTASAQADEAAALSRLREQEGIVRPLFKPYGGREIKSTGDGFLVEFESALKATECAVEIQRRLRERNTREPTTPIQLRIGIHVGDVEEAGGDIFGDAVNVASRVVPLAEPGGVCISDHVATHVRSKVPYPLERLSPRNLKGVREPLDVYRLVLPWESGGSSPSSSSLPRIAVLPLANISPDRENEYFADGLTEELITVLSQIKGLRVISRTSVNQYKGTSKPVSQIGSELGADSVLEGSVRKAGDQLRIAVQLIDTRTDEHRWAQTYDRKLENVFAIQAEVAERTAGALKVELLKSEREALQERPTSSLAAYESYLRGVQASRNWVWDVGKRQTMDREVEQYFQAAIREDPHFSAAYSHLANHLLAAMGITRPSSEVLPRIRELVANALELSPNSSDAHTAAGNLAFQGDLDWTRAEAEFQQAIAFNPSTTTARHWYGYLLNVLQRFAEGRKQDLATIELDPLWLSPRIQLISNGNLWGDLEGAIASVEKLLTTFGDSGGIRYWLAELYAHAGRAEDALKLMEPLAGATDPNLRLQRAWILLLLGKPEELRGTLAEWEQGGWPMYVSLTNRAVAYALLGEKEQALTLLETDFREGERLLWSAYRGPAFDPIRNDPRFVSMLRALKLPTTITRPLWPDGRHPPK
jgi:TolB-like protein/class 3 adenylate cyclase